MACRSYSRALLVASLLILCALRISAEIINSEQRASAPDSATASQHEQRKTKSSQSMSSTSSRPSQRSASSRDNVASYLVSWAEHLITMKGDHYAALKHFRLAGALGHAGALTSAASMQLSGENQILRDISAAVRLLRLAVAKGQPDAQAILALLHATGIADRHGVEKNVPLAILYWTFAANAGNVFANAALGFRYMFGIDVRRNCAAAAKYYKVAAKSVAVNPRSFPSPDNFIRGPFPLTSRLRPPERLRMTEEIADRTAGLPGDNEDVLHYYRHSAAHGDNDAAATLGALHLFGGHGLEPNEARAVEALNRAAVNGHGDAHGMLGHLAMRKRKNETALAHLKKSSKVGNRIGHYALGMIYLHGLLGEQVDLEKAAEHFRQASEAQHAAAFLQLGLMHWKGLGVSKNPSEAYRLFQQGARLDNVQCKFYLGHITLKGLSPVNEPSCEHALPYFKSVAEQGEWKLVFNAAADAFASHDDFGALYRYLQAAHAGVELGQYNAALLLERRAAGNISEIAHWDRPRLISAAAELYELSAKQGSSEALVRAGNMAYEETRDYRSAFSAYMRGADLMNPEAQFSVGWMYVRGLGVPQDRHLAIRYLENARTMSADAAVPVNVALVLLRIYWWAADTARSVGADKFLLAQFRRMRAAFPAVYDDSRSLMTGYFWLGTLRQLPLDVVLIILLLCALLVVLLLRKRRLASAVPTADDPHET